MSSRIAQIHLVSSHPEVYEPCDDSFALVDALLADQANLLEHHPKLCMEVGCSSGYVITSLALMLGQDVLGIHYLATDINPHSVRVTSETLEAHGVHADLICNNTASGLERRLAGLCYIEWPNSTHAMKIAWSRAYTRKVDKVKEASSSIKKIIKQEKELVTAQLEDERKWLNGL